MYTHHTYVYITTTGSTCTVVCTLSYKNEKMNTSLSFIKMFFCYYKLLCWYTRGAHTLLLLVSCPIYKYLLIKRKELGLCVFFCYLLFDCTLYLIPHLTHPGTHYITNQVYPVPFDPSVDPSRGGNIYQSKDANRFDFPIQIWHPVPNVHVRRVDCGVAD